MIFNPGIISLESTWKDQFMTSIPAKLDLTLVSNWITMFQGGQPFFFSFFFSLLCPRMWSLLRSGTERYVLEIRKRQAPPQFLPQKSITKYHRRKGVFAHTFLTNIFFFHLRLSMQNPQRAISALGLLVTCMYTGKKYVWLFSSGVITTVLLRGFWWCI